jgi:hypothetical protein
MGDQGAWVREHKVCWEIGPFRQFVKGHGMRQTGYELNLFGRYDPAAQEDDEAAVRGVYEGLRALALELLRSFPEPAATIEVLSFDQAVHLRPESRFADEIELTVIASPADPDHPMPPAEAQRRIGEVEDELRSMGLHKRSWDGPGA